MSVAKEMSLGDPHYRPLKNEATDGESPPNPFLTLPRLREGKKIVGPTEDDGKESMLFSSCFELPSPARGPTPTGSALTILEQQQQADFEAFDFNIDEVIKF